MLHLVIYQPQIPGNTGNIIRTAVAIGAKLHIVGPLPYTLDEKHLKRAGMDYIENIDYHLYDTFEEFKENNKFDKLYCVTRYGKKTYAKYDFSDVLKDYYLIFGREDRGLPDDILKDNLDSLMRIPMVANARSLNLSNCVALVSFEVMRQQDFYNLSSFEVIKGSDYIYEK